MSILCHFNIAAMESIQIALSVQFRTKFKGLSGPKFDVLGLESTPLLLINQII